MHPKHEDQFWAGTDDAKRGLEIGGGRPKLEARLWFTKGAGTSWSSEGCQDAWRQESPDHAVMATGEPSLWCRLRQSDDAATMSNQDTKPPESFTQPMHRFLDGWKGKYPDNPRL